MYLKVWIYVYKAPTILYSITKHYYEFKILPNNTWHVVYQRQCLFTQIEVFKNWDALEWWMFVFYM